jgi:TPP-dependent pyruvate/acetoin dehydrogenase alpha subunit
MFDPDLYRDKAEIEEWKKRDPISRFKDWILSTNLAHREDIEALEADVAYELEAAVSFAEAAPWEPVEDLTRDVHTRAAAAAT